MKRAILSLLLIAMMVLSTASAMAQPFTPTGSMNDGEWNPTGTWIRTIQYGAMADTSATARHLVETGASGKFSLDFNTKVGTISCITDLGVITENGKHVTVRYDPTDLFFYVYVDGSKVATLGHNNFNAIDNFHTVISSEDGNTYNFKVQDHSTSVDIGSVPGQVYVSFDNNGVSSAYDEVNNRYNVPILYSLDFQSEETPLPEATILSASTQKGTAPLKVEFTGTATNGPCTYDWDFNDGSEHGTGASITHLFTAPGTYTVQFTATNIEGTSEPDTIEITVEEAPPVSPNAPVVTSLTADKTGGEAPLTVTFAAEATNEPTSYEWNFDDGSEPGSGSSVTHTFTEAKTYLVEVVAANDGGEDAEYIEITVTAPEVIPAPASSSGDHAIDPAQAKAFCDYQFYSPDSIVTYDGKGGYTVSDPRKTNTTSVANPASGPTLFAVSGQVISAADNKPIADASVVLDNAMQKTNGNGEFKFDGLKAGKYDLAVSADGYVGKTATVDVSEDKLISLQLEKVSAGIAISASAANETANMTTTTTDSSAVAANATATPSTARSPGFEFIAVLIAILVVAGVLVFVWRKK